ncbi:hypothetical protein LTR56_010224 [Elasticomyces elasticus]|nr:hypothetical protein LTR22_017226 [Elasticomyces elasticus]KAK3643486.1 hypothetical protein LTR56_010224 [Elasticomyces elasticus]KAK4925306.1 hypothetical protein LTR49_007604 [Elasticomyces elasticus]KAK5761323.1 hypothetical protein LTS12_008599 [Elasticomyces elasticus]
MEENSMAAPTSRPWYSKDMRTMDSRYYAVRNIFKSVGLDDGAHHLLSYERVNPWNENEDLGVFDDWFQRGPRKPKLIVPFVSSWMAEDVKDTTSRFQPVRKLLRKIKDCEFALAAMRMGIVDAQDNPHQADDRAKCIAKVGDVSALGTSLQNEFQALVSSAPFKDAYSKDQACTTCSDVFLIPELVEHILDFVNVEDVLRVQQVNKSLRKIIDVACMIQRGLGLQSDLDGYLHLPLAVHPKVEHQRNFPGFSCRAEILSNPLVSVMEHCIITHDVRRALPPAQRPEARVCARIECSEGGRLPEIGIKYRDMLVCQPPITSMTMKISYFPNTDKWTEEEDWKILPIPDWGDEDDQAWPVVTTAGLGLTLGEMWDGAKELLRKQTKLSYEALEVERLKHPNSGEIGSYDHYRMNKHLYGVGLIVTFTGTVQLRHDDPALAAVGDQTGYYEDQDLGWWNPSKAATRRRCERNNKRARAYRRMMRAEMRDCKAPTWEELQAACTAIRSAKQVWGEEDARDAEAAGQKKMVVDPETWWWYDDTEGDSSW